MVAERVVLLPSNDDYKEVKSKFDRNNTTFDKKTQKKTFFVIVKIEKVNNYKLYQKFLQKEKEYLSQYGSVQKFQLFHGTKKANISSILESNLDVKRYGQNIGCRFGAGVSFSASASYASHYCDKNETDTMLLCEVLISNIVEVREIKNKNLVMHEPPYLPNRYPLRYDTTAKNKFTMDVVVKFERDSFYPAYVITFERRLKGNPSSSYISHNHMNVSQSFSYVNPSNSNVFQTPLYGNPSHFYVMPATSHVPQGVSNDNAIHFNVSRSQYNVNPRQSYGKPRITTPNVYPSPSNVGASHSSAIQSHSHVNPVTRTSSVSQGLSNVHSSHSNVNASLSSHANANPSKSSVRQSHSESHSSVRQTRAHPQSSDSHMESRDPKVGCCVIL